MNNTEKVLSVKGLDAYYVKNKNVLSGLDLELEKNEAVGLIGLNGAGKTTLIKTLSGLHGEYSAESISSYGKSCAFRSEDFKYLRYTVFSEDNSFQFFTFREYISYVFAAYKTALPDVSELVKGFHFEEYTDKLLKDLSMGNRRKVYLITAFALKPELLLLDEPVNGLDFQSTEYLYSLISDYRKYGTVLFSSHILESITLTCDKVLVLEQGRITRKFTGDEIDPDAVRKALKLDDVI